MNVHQPIDIDQVLVFPEEILGLLLYHKARGGAIVILATRVVLLNGELGQLQRRLTRGCWFTEFE